MKALLNLFAAPSPKANSTSVMPHPTEFLAPELEAMQDALKLLADTQPEWRKAYRQQAQVKIGMVLKYWRDWVKEHS